MLFPKSKMIFKIHFQNDFQTKVALSKNRKNFCKNPSRTSARYLSRAINFRAGNSALFSDNSTSRTRGNSHHNNDVPKVLGPHEHPEKQTKTTRKSQNPMHDSKVPCRNFST